MKLSRRDFLKLSGLALGGLALNPFVPSDEPGNPFLDDQDQGELVRIAVKEVDLYAQPRDGAAIVGKRYRDQVVHVYHEIIPPDAPAFYNRLWYRVWGGYIHSAHTQRVRVRLNAPISAAPSTGQLSEVTVPYTQPYNYSRRGGWTPKPVRPLYYETTHWVTDVLEGPDGEPWYQIVDEISDSEVYYVRAIHLRPIANEEIAPISPDVPPGKKRIEVSLRLQTVYAFEGSQQVYKARISSGLPRMFAAPGENTITPKGEYTIYSKTPSKHMGGVSGNPDIVEAGGGFMLPGVPWTLFFVPEVGIAFHGTYWHTNFGLQMSHGCVNMRNEDARWLFRWTTPVFDPTKTENHRWEVTGNGTSVLVY